jgi:membrane protease YdiL (CAAX protease family)
VPPPSRIALTLALLAAVGASFVPPLLRGRLEPAELALWQTLAAQVSWCGIAGGFALLLGGSPRERLGLVRGNLSASGTALAALGTLALSGALQFAVSALALAPGSSLERLDALVESAAPRHAGLVLVAFGIAPGFGEELLFRGAIQRSLGRAVGVWCVPLAALGFGALHLDLVHSPAAFVLGCYLGATAWLSRTTWTAIACHVANNCAATLPQLGAALPRPDSWLEAGSWLAASGLALALAAHRSRKLAPPRANASG